MSARIPRSSVVLLATIGVALALATVSGQTPSSQAFRSRTTLTPVDVRVLDRNGKPVTDLTAADFVVLENGRPQKIDFFSANRLTPTRPDTGAGVRGGTPQGTLAPQNRRLFLIVLGRGRLQAPSKGIDATLRFVRERLMPQDQVAVMAWNRATDFSTDRKNTLAVLERFQQSHEEIESLMQLQFGGLSGYYAPRTTAPTDAGFSGGAETPTKLQSKIDGVFGGPQSGTWREVLPSKTMGRPEQEVKQTLDAMMQRELETFRLFGGTDVTLANSMRDLTLDIGFDAYVSLSRQTMQDVGNLYAGIDYLRYIEGEKHIIYVTEQGFRLPRVEHDRDLATMAADARVAIDTLQTGGVAVAFDIGGGGDDVFFRPAGSIAVPNGFALSALRDVSEFTGGEVSVSQMADKAYDRILSATEFGYLLGYSSNGQAPNLRARNIKVEVKRRGVTVSHRKAYIARSEEVRFDPRESLATTRLVAAAAYGAEVKDLRLSATLTEVRDAANRTVNVDVTVAGDRLIFARSGGEYVAALTIAVMCGDRDDKNLGQVWESRDVRIPAARLDEIKRTGIVVPVRVPVSQRPAAVKIMVYDYGSDLVGSIVKTMR